MRCIMSTFNKMLYLSASFIILNAASDALANPDIGSLSPTPSLHSLELRPDNSYQLAKATFLPDTKDDLGFSGHDFSSQGSNGSYNKGDPCKTYTLKKCPTHGKCSTCPTSTSLYKLNSCDNGWKISGDTCVPAVCTAINSSYKSSVPTNNICTKVTESGLTCYKDCRSVSCSGYTLNCDNFNVSNATSKAACPDCLSANSNCSTQLCKVAACQSGYKIANNGTSCQALDDNCPSGYYKTCDTGIESTVSPKYTEAGTACYQCKTTSNCDSSSVYRNMNGSYTVSASQTAIDLYGQYNTTTIPSSGVNVCFAGWTYPSGATVNGGPLNVTGDMAIGIHGGTMATPITFNVPVTVNGKIHFEPGSEFTFNRGLTGDYKCYELYGTGAPVTCPFTVSCNESDVYRNINGSYTVSASQTAINLYGQSNTTTIPSDGVNVCWAGWTYPSGATINGGPLYINGNLVLGIHGGQMKTNATFNVPVTVNGKIYLFDNSRPTFNKGISGNYTCYSNYDTVISCPF